eukprot:1284984-Rhodomonas_salina.3
MQRTLATAWLATSSAAERFARQPSVALLYLPYTHVPYWSVSPHSHPGRDCTPHLGAVQHFSFSDGAGVAEEKCTGTRLTRVEDR